MIALAKRLRTYMALGPANVLRVAAYRVSLRSALHPVRRLRASIPAGPFFAARERPAPAGAMARRDWREDGLWFGIHAFPIADRPDWHANPFTGARAGSVHPWFAIPDFDPVSGDIKTIWEASRFDWLLAMAQRAALGDRDELARLNLWLSDWLAANPPYRGANWKCGQEASIRVMHLVLAAMLLDQVKVPHGALLDLVELHLARIAPTTGYAIGQRNNHGTSEATALFVGGSWLHRAGRRRGARWTRTGRQMLEECARALIARDGSFSQYSLTYHRLMLDSYSLAESWRRHLDLPVFSLRLMDRLAGATRWLRQMTDTATGDGPNYGANDGARLMALTDSNYRDFRPALQWAAALFLGQRAVAQAGPWDQALCWLDIALPERGLPEPESMSFSDGGMHVLRQGDATAYFYFPRFRFRPSQSDALHVDFWVAGQNILRDAGTFSYNASAEDMAYFSGTAAHNTVEFDGRDQMPRMGRFLFGAWLKAERVKAVEADGGGVHASASYRDYCGARHEREVHLEPGLLSCTDRLSGNGGTAVLRWRLQPGSWEGTHDRLRWGRFRLSTDCEAASATISLEQGLESRYYLQKSRLPVLEVRTLVPAIIHTRLAY